MEGEEGQTSQQIRSGRALTSHRGRQTILAEARVLQRLSWEESVCGWTASCGIPGDLTKIPAQIGEILLRSETPCIGVSNDGCHSLENGIISKPVMAIDLKENFQSDQSSELSLEQSVLGFRRFTNVIISSAVTIGGVGFSLASASSFFGKDLLPLGQPSQLIFVPQGLLLGIYGIAAFLLATYLWMLYIINFGSGINKFDKESGFLLVTRRGFFKEIKVEIPLKDIKAVKIEMRDGINPKRRISLRLQGRRDLPLTRVGQPLPMAQLEKDGANLARFLNVNLEGL